MASNAMRTSIHVWMFGAVPNLASTSGRLAKAAASDSFALHDSQAGTSRLGAHFAPIVSRQVELLSSSG